MLTTEDVENKSFVRSDIRLKDPKFREAVRFCFIDLGCENTTANFYRLRTKINWIAYAHKLLYPTQMAKVELLCKKERTGKRILVALPGRTKALALAGIDKRRYIFERWWL